MMTKSTASSSRYSRIGTHPPTRKTSGARPFLPLGTCASSNTGIVPRCFDLVPRLGLGGLPRIAPVEIHTDIAPWARRAAKANLVPSDRVGVIKGDDVRQQ